MGENRGGRAVGGDIAVDGLFGQAGRRQLGLPDVESLAVHQQEQLGAGLLEFRFQNGAVARLFVDDALAFRVDEDGAHRPAGDVARDGGLRNALAHFHAVRVTLAVLHQAGRGVDAVRRRHDHAVAGGGRRAVVERGGQLVAEQGVARAVAAGRQNHVLSGDDVGGALVGLRGHAGHLAVFHVQALRTGGQQHGRAALLHRLAHAGGKARAAADIGQLAVVAVLAQLMQAALHIEGNAAILVQPIGGRADVLGIQVDQFRHVEVRAVLHEVLHHGFHSVIRHAGLSLKLAAHDDLVAAADGDRAAEEGSLLQQDHVLAELLEANRRRHTGRAAADNHHVGGHFNRLGGEFLLNRDSAQRVRVAARLRHSVRHGVHNAFGGEGRAALGVHRKALAGDNLARQVVDRGVRNARGLLMIRHHDIGDRILGEGDVHGDFAVTAVRLAGVGSGGIAVGQRRRAHHHGERQQHGKELLVHLFFLLK